MYGPYKGKKMNPAKKHERGTDAFPIRPTGKNVAIDNEYISHHVLFSETFQ